MTSRLTDNQRGGAMIMSIVASIGIFAMLSSLSIPYLKKYQTGLKLNAAAKILASDLRYAQQSTITEQTVHRLQFDAAARRYSVLKTGAATTTVKSVDLPADIGFQSISANLGGQVVFNSFGGVSQSGQIILGNAESMTAIVNVKPSGYVELVQ